MHLRYITLHNIRNFRNLDKFPLEKQGMVLINGENGVGKTTFASAIRDCLFGTMIDGSSNDSLVRNDRDAQILVSLENNGYEYIIEKTRTKGKWKRTITKNGIPITTHSQGSFYVKVVEELGFTKEEWDASVHLSQKGSHVLVSGKPTDRKEYISEFFGIDGDFDIVKEAAELELELVSKSIKDIEAYSTARATLHDELFQTIIPNIDVEAARRINCKESIDINTKVINELNDKLKIYNTFIQYKDAAYPENYGENVDIDYSLEHYRKLKSDTDSMIKNYDQIKVYNENVLKNNVLFDELTNSVKQNEDFDIRFPESAEVYQKETNDLEIKRSLSMERGKLQKSIDLLKDYEGKELYTDIAMRESDLKAKTSEYAILDHEYKRIAQGKCPTCGHEHEATDILDKWTYLVKIYNTINEMTTFLSMDKEHNRKVDELAALKTRLSSIPEFYPMEALRLDELLYILPKLRVYNNQKDQLSRISKQEFANAPDQPPTDQDIANINYSITFFLNISNARKICPKPSEVEGINSSNIKSNINTLIIKNSSLEEEIRKIDATILNAKESQARYDRLANQIKIIDEKFDTLGKLKEAEFFWKTMVQAYGPKGIRVTQLQKIMNLITDVLPMYTSIMFEASKSYEFMSECDAGNIVIKVKRKDEEGVYEYDIASCSGGESKKIAVCLILAVAKIRLARKKVNMVILDEIDSQIDKAGRFQFTNELLPAIREQFETVFVISHHDDTFQTAIYDKKLIFKQENENSHYTKIVEINYAN